MELGLRGILQALPTPRRTQRYRPAPAQSGLLAYAEQQWQAFQSLNKSLAVIDGAILAVVASKETPAPNVLPMPEDIANVIDRAFAAAPKNAETDAQGRLVRGVYAGMTPAEVIAQRDSFRRIVGE